MIYVTPSMLVQIRFYVGNKTVIIAFYGVGVKDKNVVCCSGCVESRRVKKLVFLERGSGISGDFHGSDQKNPPNPINPRSNFC